MFSLGVLETDAFMDLPLSAQALYFHLCLRADDDGFVGNPKRIVHNIGASLDDLRLLVLKRFVLAFEDGVIVIKHWRMHNLIKSDRYIKTNYTEDLALLKIKDNGAYTMSSGTQMEPVWNPFGTQMEPVWNPNGTQMEPKCSVGKDSIGKDSIGKDSIGKDSKEETPINGGKEENRKRFSPPTVEDVKDYVFEKGLDIDATRFVDFYESKGWMVGKNKMKDWKAACRTWAAKDRTDRKTKPKGNSWDDWKDV